MSVIRRDRGLDKLNSMPPVDRISPAERAKSESWCIAFHFRYAFVNLVSCWDSSWEMHSRLHHEYVTVSNGGISGYIIELTYVLAMTQLDTPCCNRGRCRTWRTFLTVVNSNRVCGTSNTRGTSDRECDVRSESSSRRSTDRRPRHM